MGIAWATRQRARRAATSSSRRWAVCVGPSTRFPLFGISFPSADRLQAFRRDNRGCALQTHGLISLSSPRFRRISNGGCARSPENPTTLALGELPMPWPRRHAVYARTRNLPRNILHRNPPAALWSALLACLLPARLRSRITASNGVETPGPVRSEGSYSVLTLALELLELAVSLWLLVSPHSSPCAIITSGVRPSHCRCWLPYTPIQPVSASPRLLVPPRRWLPDAAVGSVCDQTPLRPVEHSPNLRLHRYSSRTDPDPDLLAAYDVATGAIPPSYALSRRT